ncbi:MAG: FtsX-like permease family protein [bacterium]|nr:FtsX-like permease family protein [bacterium]
MKNKPPKSAELLIKFFSNFDEEFDLCNTLRDLYCHRSSTDGRLRANLWYWRQVFYSLFKNRISNFIWSIIMFKNYLKIALRNIKRYKTYSIVNISGLALGIASSLLILVYTNFEFSFDKYHSKADRIYRFAADGTQGDTEYGIAQMHSSVSEYLDINYPEIENIVRLSKPNFESISYNDNTNYENGLYYADETVFDIFDVELIKGDPATALKTPFSIVMSQELANKYFKNEDPVGKVIKIDERFDFTVKGIIKKPPVNSHLQYDGLVSLETIKQVFPHAYEHRAHFDFYTYLLLKEGGDYKELETKLSGFFDEQFADIMTAFNRKLDVVLQPLTSIHLRSDLLYDNPGNTNISYIYGLITSAVFILLIAIFNYVNLSTVRWTKRTKEIGMRKVLGAFKKQIILQCFGESVLNTAIAFIIGVVLVIFTFPYLQYLSGYNLSINFLGDTTLIIQSVLILIIISLAASAYSAFFLSGFRPIKVIKGIQSAGNNISFSRNALVVMQFLISITLIIVTIGVFSQIDYLKNEGLGFNDELLVYAPVYTDNMGYGSEKADIWMSSIKQELLLLEDVNGVSFASSLPGSQVYLHEMTPDAVPDNRTISTVRYEVCDDFLKTMEIDIVKGRGFLKEFPKDRDNSVIINETAAKLIGWEDPIGKKLKTEDGEQEWSVVGVMKDIHSRSLHHEIDPMMFLNFPHSHFMLVRIKPDNIDNAISRINAIWDKLEPEHTFEYGFVEDRINNMYNSEAKLSRIIQIFVFLAISISCLGIFGFISYMIEQRTKEIGIRKTFGATEFSIVNIFVKNLATWIVMANILAFPLGYFIMNKWLETYAYRIEIGWEIFILSGLSAFALALITIMFQTIKAACARPVDTLRYE